MNRQYDYEEVIDMMAAQINLWQNFYLDNGYYRDDTIFLKIGDVAIVNPFEDSEKEILIDPLQKYEEKAYFAWQKKVEDYVKINGVG